MYYEFTVVYFIEDEGVIDHDRTVVGKLVDGQIVPFTLEEAIAYAEATGGALHIN